MTAHRTRGHELLAALIAGGLTRAEVGATIGASRQLVAQIASGRQTPRVALRRVIAARYPEIPASSWTEAPVADAGSAAAAPRKGRARSASLKAAAAPLADAAEALATDDVGIDRLREIAEALWAARLRPSIVGTELAAIARAESAIVERHARLQAASRATELEDALAAARRAAESLPAVVGLTWTILSAISPSVASAYRDALNGSLPDQVRWKAGDGKRSDAGRLGLVGVLAPGDAGNVRQLADLIAAVDTIEPDSVEEHEQLEAVARWLLERRRAWLARLDGGRDAT